MTDNLPKCTSFADFVRILNDGELHTRLSEALREINANLNDHAHEFGGAAKGKLTLAIEFKLKGGVFEIAADFSTSLPKVKPNPTIVWSTPENYFTPQNPRQTELFGPREVRDVTSGDARDVRTV